MHPDPRASLQTVKPMDRYTEPEWNRYAPVTIDTRCDPLDEQPFEIPGTSAILPRMRLLLDAFRAAQDRSSTSSGRSNVDLCRRRLVETGAQLALAGSPGCQLAPEILPHPDICLDGELLLSHGIQTIGPGEVVIKQINRV
jgi:hypothetical protein